MKFHNITKCDLLNGQGIRVVLWVAGCEHHCPGCHNPITHDPDGGVPFDHEAYKELVEALDKPYVKGVTFSGGDPLATYNRETITALAKDIKEQFPNKDIWCYTGYSYEAIKELEIMEYLDVLCDGRFIENLKDTKLHWIGSSNQRVIDIPKSRLLNQIVLIKD